MINRLANCEPRFYENCKNAHVKCKLCVAGSGKQNLYYEPYTILEEDHPATNWKDSKLEKQRILRRAKQTESNIARNIVQKTIRSGAANHDGDLLIAQDVRVEVKRRGRRQSWNVTVKEYDKGLQQGIDVFAIEIERDDTGARQTLYCCTEDFFTSLVSHKLEQIKQLED
jgi:hypothetical protein